MPATVNSNKICALHGPAEQKPTTGVAIKPWYCDRVDVREFSFSWKIENFSSLMGETTSPVFTSKDCSKIKWQLALSKIERIVILKLRLVCSDQPRLNFKFKATVLSGGGQAGRSIGRDTLYTASPKDVFIFPRPMEIEDLQNQSREGVLLQDTLCLVCDISVIIDIIDITLCDINGLQAIESTLHDDMGKLLESGKFSDVTLVVAGKMLPAHKNILSLRSEVFAAMFEHDLMEESKSNRVVINDLDYRVIREMLTFIYSNKSPNIDEMAEELLAAADKYALKNLKMMCEALLDRDLTLDTALATLVLADRHSSQLLRARSIHYIKANSSTIMKTQEWQTMISNYSHLIEDIENYNGCI